MTNYLISVFKDTRLNYTPTKLSNEKFIRNIIYSLKYPSSLEIYFTVRLAEAQVRNIFNEVYAILSMTKYAKLAHECKLLLP